MDKRHAARKLARMGLRIFRLQHGTKDHFIDTDWTASASADAATVWDRWSETPTANIGVLATGYVIIDVDDKKGLQGSAELAKLFPDLPPTFTDETPTGGRHLFFKCAPGESFGQTALGLGLDVRATNGYVLGPGSWTDEVPGKSAAGEYRIIVDAPIAPLPEIVRAKLREVAAARNRQGSRVGTTDTPAALARARAYLEREAPRASIGQRGYTALRVAQRVGDFGVSREAAAELLEEWNETHCDPPQDLGELHFSIRNAYRYRKSSVGIENHGEHFDAIAAEDLAELEPDADFESNIFTLDVHSDEDEAAIEVVPWLSPGRMIRGSLGAVISPPGIGKSTLALHWAAALATLNPAIGLDVSALEAPVSTLVYNAEDPDYIMRARLAAICRRFGLPWEQVNSRVFMWSGQSGRSLLAIERKRVGRDVLLTPTDQLERLTAFVKRRGVSAVILDPLIEIHEAEENDNADMGRVMKTIRERAGETAASWTLIHHTKKPPAASSESYAGNPDSARGASAIIGNVRLALTLFGMSEKDAETYGVAPALRHQYLRLDDGKQSFTAKRLSADWLKREMVLVKNGEVSPVLVPVALTTAAQKAAPALARVLYGHMKPGASISLADAEKMIAGAGIWPEQSADTTKRRIVEAFEFGPLEVDGFRITFTPSAKGGRGGSLVLTRE